MARGRKNIDLVDLDELKRMISDHRAKAKVLRSNFDRLNREYEDWEDRTAKIEDLLYKAEEQYGIPKEVIAESTGDPYLDEIIALEANGDD